MALQSNLPWKWPIELDVIWQKGSCIFNVRGKKNLFTAWSGLNLIEENILKNSGKQIRIAKGLYFDGLVLIKSENVARLRKKHKTFVEEVNLLHNLHFFYTYIEKKNFIKCVPYTQIA